MLGVLTDQAIPILSLSLLEAPSREQKIRRVPHDQISMKCFLHFSRNLPAFCYFSFNASTKGQSSPHKDLLLQKSAFEIKGSSLLNWRGKCIESEGSLSISGDL